MPDARFYASLGPVPLGALAQAVGAELADGSAAGTSIHGVAPLAEADEGAVAFLGDRRYLAELAGCRAAAVFVTPDFAAKLPAGVAALVTSEPQAAYARAATRLHAPLGWSEQTRPVSPDARLEDGVRLAPGVVVGPGAEIGRGTVVGPNAVIGPGVALGRDCEIGANVSIGFALIGDRVRILAGAVVGEAGFGVAGGRSGAIDVPQLGRVILQDGVTVGANTCIDRGAFGDTVVGENTKIDNLVQIAHNVRIGRNCMLAAHTGLSGSVVVGDGAAFGGRAGIADHLTIGAGARVAAAAGIMKDIPAGETWGGAPGRPVRQYLREVAYLSSAAAGGKRKKGGEGA